MKSLSNLLFAVLLAGLIFSCNQKSTEKLRTGPRQIEILLLGHASEHHNSALLLPMLTSALAKDGINFTYTEDPADLNPENLAYYDGLMIYANHETIEPAQEKALLDF